MAPPTQPQQNVKAVGLISGGLDSMLAAKVVRDLGAEVHGLYFSMPWGCCSKDNAQRAADLLGIKFLVLQLDKRYLDVIKEAKHGYGSALNPCVDCRIHMFTRAAKYMESIGADFVFTGEVLGQRPMSQMRHSMKTIEEGSRLQGRLLRPLCAQLLEPTIPEQQGLIDRERLLKISGRSRREQIRLAEEAGIKDYPNAAGGCLLTDPNFARRMKDVFEHGYKNFRETVALQWGRHYRIDENFKIIVGRDEDENLALKHFAHPDDFIFEIPDKIGPTVVLKGQDPTDTMLSMAAGCVQKFSRQKNADPVDIEYWSVKDKTNVQRIRASKVTDEFLSSVLV